MADDNERLARAREALERATRAAREQTDEPGERRRRSAGGRRGDRRVAEPPTDGSAAIDREPDPESVARTIALRQLTSAPRSRAQLAQAMARKDVPEAVADRVLDRFEEVGLVDDAAYAGMLVRTRQADRGLARTALAVELRRKGIDAVTAQVALAEVDGDDEIDAARAVIAKRLRSMSGLDVEVKRRRLVATLARKGHPPGLSFRVVDEALQAESG